MRAEPQAAPYRPDPQILALAGWLADPVEPAAFPKAELRFRNRRWDRAVGLGELADDVWVRHFGRFDPLPDNLRRPPDRQPGGQGGAEEPARGEPDDGPSPPVWPVVVS